MFKSFRVVVVLILAFAGWLYVVGKALAWASMPSDGFVIAGILTAVAASYALFAVCMKLLGGQHVPKDGESGEL